MNFSILIPTYKREKDLEICLEFILGQSKLPDEVLIIDDASLPSDFIYKKKEEFKDKNIEFIYHKKDHAVNPRGSSESRNLGIELSQSEIFFILDDDLILDNDFFEKIMEVWEENNDKNLIGVGGLIKNNRKKIKLEKVYNKLFCLTGEYRWDVNDVGFQVWDEGIVKKEKGYYVHGGACSYKKLLVKELGGFTTFSGGRTALEDVDFCLRAKNKGYYFVIQPKSKVIHNHSPLGRENNFLIGFKESYNRKVIFRNNCKKTLWNNLWFIWANIGWVLRQFLTFQFIKPFGMIKGLFTKIDEI